MAKYLGPKTDPANVATKSDVDGKLDSSVGNFGSWTSYTPTLTATTTNPNLGSTGTATGHYTQIGKLVVANFKVTFSGTGIDGGSGTYRIAAPVTAATFMNDAGLLIGTGRINNGSGFICAFRFASTAVIEILYQTTGLGVVSNSLPASWDANEYIRGQITYEAA